MDSEKLEVDCKEHGKGVAAVVCRHLVNNNGAPLGFIENSSIPGDFQGWCYACEFVYNQENDMTERFRTFNDMALVCEQCYSRIKSKHQQEP